MAFPGANTLFALMLFGMFIPYQAVLIPLFQFIKGLGLYGSIWGLILAHVVYGIPITTLIFRNFYADVPDALVEAATIDGAGFWEIYARVIFPISIPGFVVVIIWQFTQVWNEFLFAATLTNTGSQPVTYALSQLAGVRRCRGTCRWPGPFWRRCPPCWCTSCWGAISCAVCWPEA